MDNRAPTVTERDMAGGAWQQRLQAIAAISTADFLVRRVSVAERAPFENIASARQISPQLLNDLFPPGFEGNKVFSLDRRYTFTNSRRNMVEENYFSTMLIPTSPRMTEFFRDRLYPDSVPGGLPDRFKRNPAFKQEGGTTTIVIRKGGWQDFWDLVDDVEYTPGFISYGRNRTVGY